MAQINSQKIKIHPCLIRPIQDKRVTKLNKDKLPNLSHLNFMDPAIKQVESKMKSSMKVVISLTIRIQ